MKGVLLEDLSWVEAQAVLDLSTVVVLPLGAAAKEHGHHLRLKNDWVLAEYLKNRVLDEASVVIAPTVNYHYYPAFVEYPGSVSLRLETARDLIVDICRSLNNFGPKRFYVLNTGISTLKPLEQAAELLLSEHMLLKYTDLDQCTGEFERTISEQEGGSHADEIETSVMLYIAPDLVDMSKAKKDYDSQGKGPFTRKLGDSGIYSPTGAWGDPTLATREKGAEIVKALAAAILQDIEELRKQSV